MTTRPAVKLSCLADQTREIWSDLEPELLLRIQSSEFINGPAVEAFESAFAAFLGVKHCVGVGNGTDALEIALECLNVGKGDEVLVPAFSYSATASSVIRSGARCVFLDVDDNSLVDLSLIEPFLTSKTRAFVPVHLYGHPVDFLGHLSHLKSRGVHVVEDAAQAHGARVRGQSVGSIGDCGIFSFYPGKNLGAWGDGGALVTNDDGIARKARLLRNHGSRHKFDHAFPGRNSRLDDLQAVVLSHKLKRLQGWTHMRQDQAAIYSKSFKVLKYLRAPTTSPDESVWHQYVLRVDDRPAFQDFMSRCQIETAVRYPYALSTLFSKLAPADETPKAIDASKTVVSIPIGEHLTSEHVAYVAEKVVEFDRLASRRG